MAVESTISIEYSPPELNSEDDPNARYKMTGILRCSRDICYLSKGAEINELGESVEATKRQVQSRAGVYVRMFCLSQACTLPNSPAE